jgi:CheY-like chemotaxis protein
VAPELNNPLTVILGNASLLESDAAPADIPQCVSEIRVAAQRCTRAVEDLLAFSRPHEPTRKTVDVNACIEEALRWETKKLRTRGIEIVMELAPVPVTQADPHQLQQVFLNLLVNARQAMSADSRPGILTIRSLRPTTEAIRVEVSDNGAGIPLEHQTRVFEPFFTTKEEGKGTGLGLAICARIIDEHGGTISVRSREGEGSTFVIDLPVVPQDEQSLESTDEAQEEMAPATPLSALIVDDEPDVARVVQLSLERAGHQSAVEVSSVRAAERLATESFDVIFMDLRMPDLSGPALYRELRESSPEAAGRVIFITGDTADPATLEFLRYSGRPWLTKPFTEEEVRRTLAEVQET